MRLKPSLLPFTLVALLISVFSWGQEQSVFFQNHLTEQEGLPSNEVYHVIQDNNKHMWFATDNGIVRYDGKQLKVFTTKDGLPANCVFRFYLQRDGTIYGETIGCKYFTIKDGVIEPYKYNALLAKHFSRLCRPTSFAIDRDGSHYFGGLFATLRISPKGEALTPHHLGFKKVPIHEKLASPYSKFIFQEFDDAVTISESQAPVGTKRTTFYRITKQKDTVIYSLDMPDRSSFATFGFTYNNEIWGFRFNSGLVVLDKQNIVQFIKEGKHIMGVNRINDEVWLGFPSAGVSRYKIRNQRLEKVDHFLDGYSVTSVERDHEGGYWFTTRESGVFYSNNFNLNVVYKNHTDQNISSFFMNEEEGVKLASFDYGQLIDITTEKVISNKQFGATKIQQLAPNIYESLGTHYLTFSVHPVPKSIHLFGDTAISQSLKNESQQRLYSSRRAYWLIDHEKKRLVQDTLKGSINDVLCLQNDFVFGTYIGLEIIHAPDYTQESNILTSSPVLRLEKFGNTLMVACRNGDVYRFDGKTLKSVDYQRPSFLSRIYDIRRFKDLLIIASNAGIQKFEWNQQTYQWKQIEFINLRNVIQVFTDQNRLFYVKKDIIYEDLGRERENPLPIVSISQILVNNKPIQSFADQHLSYDENNMSFSLGSVSYSSDFSEFRYQMIGHDPDYLYTDGDQVSYSALSPGTYTFVVSSTSNGIDYSIEEKYTFTITPPFWRTTWFIVFVVVLIISLWLIIYYLRMKRIKARYELQKTIDELKAKALSAQLNPHLIFNVLNSIQGIISDDEIETANIYLARFAKFIRLSLNYSRKTQISLKEEVEITQKYLELEQLRFPQLDFQLVKPTFDHAFSVPPLILQPFIENAIKHGVMPRMHENALIRIEFLHVDANLIIHIHDNGVGFEGDLHSKMGDGMRISVERIQVLNPENTVELLNPAEGTTLELTIKP